MRVRGRRAIGLAGGCLRRRALAPVVMASVLFTDVRPTLPPVDYVIVVHPSNPVPSLRREQAAALFLKRATKWPDGRNVEPVDLPPESPARIGFSQEVLRRSPSAVAAYWIQEIFAGRSEPPAVKSTEAAILEYVQHTPGAIGYVARSSRVDGARILPLIP